MTERRALGAGDVLDGRYVLQDLVTERLGATTWRAHDRVLARNVGIEMLPSDDPRADNFLEAARQSTSVTDPRFLRVLDLVESDHDHHVIVREWARAFPLDQLLRQSPLPNRRAATVVTEVAEALAHAHEKNLFHRRLTPHQVLLKQSGAVRIVGLGVATALAPAGHRDTFEDLRAYEQMDVEALGKLLYACLVARWPGVSVDGLRAAPAEGGRVLRPRQVRAGVSRDVDTVVDRILGRPPLQHRTPLRTAADIARTLRLTGEDEADVDDPSPLHISSPDLLRLDPVIVPAGPPPGLEPPRRRPKAFEPAPPTTFERSVHRARRATAGGDRKLVLAGVGLAVAVAVLLAFAVTGFTGDGERPAAPTADAQQAPAETLPVTAIRDLDPQGEDGRENPEDVQLAIDGDPNTAWRTSTYFNRPDLGGLKSGVGLVLDLGGPREVESMRILLGGTGTSLQVYASSPGGELPVRLGDLRRIATLDDAGTDVSVSFPQGTITRRVVVWLTRLPQVRPGDFQGEVREITVRGRR
jgi:putative peptidoglycan lipid II flippase